MKDKLSSKEYTDTFRGDFDFWRKILVCFMAKYGIPQRLDKN